MDPINILHSDHQKFLTLFDQIDKTTDDMPDERRELYLKLELIMTLHMLSEERVFYKELLAIPEVKDTIKKSYESHHFVDVALHELKVTSYKSETWLPKFQAIRDNILSHMEDEEEYLFPKVRELLTQEQLTNIADKMLTYRQEVTH